MAALASTTALSNPLILQNVFDAVNQLDTRTKVLSSCILVNRLWFAEAIPHAWHELIEIKLSSKWNLYTRLGALEQGRRQFYANFIESALVFYYVRSVTPQENLLLEGLTFLKLRHLKILLPDGVPNIPQIAAPEVRVIDIYTKMSGCDPPYLDEEDMEEVFNQLAQLFPKAQKVKFHDENTVNLPSVQRFKSRMPLLTTFRYRHTTPVSEVGSENEENSDWDTEFDTDEEGEYGDFDW